MTPQTKDKKMGVEKTNRESNSGVGHPISPIIAVLAIALSVYWAGKAKAASSHEQNLKQTTAVLKKTQPELVQTSDKLEEMTLERDQLALVRRTIQKE
ncbi:MAG: hypothetical protein CMO80_19315 [Verrucomicrobiales bacterium]|nr:hypothetical protein [Verrucomicrobiales bacterium]